jgi:hypothetical protein
MPSVSEPQRRAMEAAAHGDSTLGIPKKVGKEFAAADEAKARKKDAEKDPAPSKRPKAFSAVKEKAKAAVLRKPKLSPGMDGMEGEEGAV